VQEDCEECTQRDPVTESRESADLSNRTVKRKGMNKNSVKESFDMIYDMI